MTTRWNIKGFSELFNYDQVMEIDDGEPQFRTVSCKKLLEDNCTLHINMKIIFHLSALTLNLSETFWEAAAPRCLFLASSLSSSSSSLLPSRMPAPKTAAGITPR